MNRLTGDFFEILEEGAKNELQCPACHSRKFIFSNTYLTFESCKTEYAIEGGLENLFVFTSLDHE